VIKRIFLACFVGSALLACESPSVKLPRPSDIVLPSGVVLIAENASKTDALTIAYTKYRLDNGLTIVLHQDESDPLVHVDVTYHVGSAREQLGKSGFAHFFEHMMFQGSKNVADDEHFKIITEAGGQMNGTTNSDRTNYYQTVPANQLEKVLWLEADRMGFLLPAVTQEKFEIQRDTVKNERAQSYENQPYGLRSERNAEALYPTGHPYSWSTIGYVDDLNRVNVDDLKAFFQRWYGPNNAVLTIGGDIDAQKTLEWVVKYFGTIPTGPKAEQAQRNLVTLEQDTYVSFEDEVYLPLLQLTFPTVYVRHQDEAPLDVLSDILGGGKTSLFYKNLVKDNHAVQAVVSHPCRELACEFQLIALANPTKSLNLSDLKIRIDETLIEFEQRGVSQDDLNRTKVGIEASTIFGLQSVAGKVSTLAMNELFDQEPDKVQYDIDRYNAVTADDVMRVYKTYIKDKAKVVLSIVPQGELALAAGDSTFVLPERMLTNSDAKKSIIVDAIEDNFDRSKQPVAGANPVVKIPSFWQQEFDNGINMLGHVTTETPTVGITFSMEGGPLLDPIEKAGLASITAQLMNESTVSSSNEELANSLALLGSRISFGSAGRFTQVSVSSLSKNLDKTLVLLQEKLFSPAFLEQDFERIKQQLIQSLQQQLKNPSALASRAVSQLLYGNDNRVSLPDSGTLETIALISLEDVKQFYKQYYSPTHSNLVVVGDISQIEVEKKLAFLTEWKASEYSIPELGQFPAFTKPHIYLVDKPDAAQSVVRIIKPVPPYDATGEHFKSKLMNFALGGMFNSRINLNLREDKGYTYGASSRFIAGKSLGRFQASADLKKVNTADGIQEFFNEISNFYHGGVTEQELALMRSAYTQSEALRYETPASKSGFLRHLLTYGLDKNYKEAQNQIIKTISQQEIAALARKYLDLNSMQVIVVGDSAVIEESLKTLGRPVVKLSIKN
jgi:zinc protease